MTTTNDTCKYYSTILAYIIIFFFRNHSSNHRRHYPIASVRDGRTTVNPHAEQYEQSGLLDLPYYNTFYS